MKIRSASPEFPPPVRTDGRMNAHNSVVFVTDHHVYEPPENISWFHAVSNGFLYSRLFLFPNHVPSGIDDVEMQTDPLQSRAEL
jgi:hypothetical protein